MILDKNFDEFEELVFYCENKKESILNLFHPSNSWWNRLGYVTPIDLKRKNEDCIMIVFEVNGEMGPELYDIFFLRTKDNKIKINAKSLWLQIILYPTRLIISKRIIRNWKTKTID
jgi:hypothetical protein